MPEKGENSNETADYLHGVDPEIYDYILATFYPNDKVPAMKYYVEHTNASLKEAKKIIDAIFEDNRR